MIDDVKKALYDVIVDSGYYKCAELYYDVEDVRDAVFALGLGSYVEVLSSQMVSGLTYVVPEMPDHIMLEDCQTADDYSSVIKWYAAECAVRDWYDPKYRVRPSLAF